MRFPIAVLSALLLATSLQGCDVLKRISRAFGSGKAAGGSANMEICKELCKPMTKEEKAGLAELFEMGKKEKDLLDEVVVMVQEHCSKKGNPKKELKAACASENCRVYWEIDQHEFALLHCVHEEMFPNAYHLGEKSSLLEGKSSGAGAARLVELHADHLEHGAGLLAEDGALSQEPPRVQPGVRAAVDPAECTNFSQTEQIPRRHQPE